MQPWTRGEKGEEREGGEGVVLCAAANTATTTRTRVASIFCNMLPNMVKCADTPPQPPAPFGAAAAAAVVAT